MVNRNFTNISCKALGQLISLKDAASRKVAKNSVFDKDCVYYLPAIKLFIFLNFLVSTKDGKASDIIIKDLAKEINCCTKTVISSLNRLSTGKDPLISYTIDDVTKLLSVEILNYTDMFKRSGEGGLRYIVFDKDLKGRLFLIRSINEMRICVRALIECEEQGDYEASLSMKQIMAGLPSYIRPYKILYYFKLMPAIVKSTANANKTAFHVSVHKISRAKENRDKIISHNNVNVRNLISSINESIDEINKMFNLSKNDIDSKINAEVSVGIKNFLHISFNWRKAQENKMKVLPTFHFTSSEYEDAALIATQLNFEAVKGALLKYLETHILTGRGSRRNDTMAVIQNISESIFIKNKNYPDRYKVEEYESLDYSHYEFDI